MSCRYVTYSGIHSYVLGTQLSICQNSEKLSSVCFLTLGSGHGHYKSCFIGHAYCSHPVLFFQLCKLNLNTCIGQTMYSRALVNM